MRKIQEKKVETITISEDFEIPGTDIILEKGDKIQVIQEASRNDTFTFQAYGPDDQFIDTVEVVAVSNTAVKSQEYHPEGYLLGAPIGNGWGEFRWELDKTLRYSGPNPWYLYKRY